MCVCVFLLLILKHPYNFETTESSFLIRHTFVNFPKSKWRWACFPFDWRYLPSVCAVNLPRTDIFESFRRDAAIANSFFLLKKKTK